RWLRPAPTRVGAGRELAPLRTGQVLGRRWWHARSGPRHDYDVAVRLCAIGLRGQARGKHLVVHHLALEGRHRLQFLALSGLLHPISGGSRKGDELFPSTGPVSCNVEHETAPVASLRL